MINKFCQQKLDLWLSTFILFCFFNFKTILTFEEISDPTNQWKIEHNVFDWINVHRKSKNQSTLRFTLNGVQIQKVIWPSLNSTIRSIRVELSDKTAIKIEKKLLLQENVTEYQFVWKTGGPSLNREICFHYGFNNASWQVVC